MTELSFGAFLLWEGALVAALCVARTLCRRFVVLEAVPVAVRAQIERGNHWTPAVTAAAVAAMVVGAVLCLLP